jgi:Ala-tRNA(Pro) deacylase
MISVRLKKFLDDNLVGFDVVQHDPAFTAQELAARMHVPGREFVKVVVVKLNGAYALAALPAHRRIDLKALARAAGVRKCSLATENEFQQLFTDCEVGAMPPFGNLYNLPTYVDQEVAYNEVIVINAGTHAEAIRVRFGDLKRLVHPRVGSFAVPPPIEVAARRKSAAGRKAKKKKAAAKRKRLARKKKKKAAKKKKKVVRRKKKPTRKKVKHKKKAKKAKTKTRKPARKKTKKKAARKKKKAARRKPARKKAKKKVRRGKKPRRR